MIQTPYKHPLKMVTLEKTLEISRRYYHNGTSWNGNSWSPNDSELIMSLLILQEASGNTGKLYLLEIKKNLDVYSSPQLKNLLQEFFPLHYPPRQNDNQPKGNTWEAITLRETFSLHYPPRQNDNQPKDNTGETRTLDFPDLFVDVSCCEFIDSTGINILKDLQKIAGRNRSQYKIISNQKIKSILERLQLDKFFAVYSSLEEALESYSPRSFAIQ